MPAKAYSTKGLQIWFGDTVVTTVTPTAITKAKPAVVTAAAITALDGDVAYMASTGFPELDGKYFTLSGVTATSMTLVGSNTTDSDGTLAGTPKIEVTEKSDLIDLSCIAKTIVFNRDAPASVAAGTYCDPSLSIASPIVPPTSVELTGNINIADPAYRELLDATEDGLTRVVDIVLPFGQGDIVGPATTTVVNWDLPVDGVQGFSATMSYSSAPAHRF